MNRDRYLESLANAINNASERAHGSWNTARERVAALSALVFGLSLLGLQLDNRSAEWAIATCWAVLLTSIFSAAVLAIIDAAIHSFERQELVRAEREMLGNKALEGTDVSISPARFRQLTWLKRTQRGLFVIAYATFIAGLSALAVFAWANL